MNEKFLEQFYEAIVLPRYTDIVTFNQVTWVSHGRVGPDSWAHYFQVNDTEYILVYEDFPDGAPFNDDLSHEVIKLGAATSIELKFTDGGKQIPNLLGWYTLFREKSR